jgi:hypothetical protein
MLSDSERDELNNSMRSNRTVWFSMIISVFIYAVIANILEDRLHGIEDVGNIYITIEKTLFGVTFVILVVTAYLRKILLSPPAKGIASQQTTAVARYTTVTTVSLALAESIAILGFVLFILGGSFQTLYALCIISVVAMFYYKPKMEDLEKLAEAMKKNPPAK